MQRYNRQMRYHAFGEYKLPLQCNHFNTWCRRVRKSRCEILARMGAHHLAIVDMDR